MTPPALPGEMWRGVLDGLRNVAIARRDDGLRALVWERRAGVGAWFRVWDDSAAAIFCAWAEHERARADAAEAALADVRRQLGRAQDELDAYRDERRGRATP